jgi:class 3 adenylate cyclase/tetratricopeptide (TPR) repeat protein
MDGVPPNEVERLEHAIELLDERRDELGDAVVDAALGPMRQRLAQLTISQRSRRRQVTVLFADVFGYTTLGETLDPERVGDLVDRLWDGLDRIVVAHGGRVVQHMGDGVMALWGGERSQEDDAERAVRAGLAMTEHMAGFEAGDGLGAEAIKIRVGINTGLVHLGHVGVTDEFRATGDTVNVASRLETNAEPGTVLISRTTYHQVRGVFDVTHAGDLQLKGRAEAVSAYRVDRLRPRAFRVRARGVEGLETRMVGRGAHLGRLTEAHEQTLGSGEPRVVVVTGEPGIGKSRLLYEYRDWIETSTSTAVRWFEGRCQSDTADRPLGLVRDLFANRFEINDDDDPETVLRKLEDGLAELVGPPGHLTATLGWLLGFGPSLGEADREGMRMRRSLALADLVATLSRLGGETRAIFALEDLHWADESSLDVLEQAIAARPEGVVVVATTRPRLGETRPAWLAESGLAPWHRVVRLAPLAPNEAGELVTHILRYADNVPEPLVARVVDNCDGNPFHVEELIKVLIDDGVVTTGPRWHVDEARLSDHRVPDTLTGVLQARLDRLPPGQFRVLQRASVFGRFFWAEALAALAEDEVDVESELDGLVDAELVFRRVPSRFQHTVELSFQHEFTRSVAYETIALDQRPELHRRAAAWLEWNTGMRVGELALPIARHYDEAGDRGAAFAWYQRAARHAEHQSAYADAARLWREAVDRAGDDEERAQSTFSLSYTLVVAGEFEQAKELLLELRVPAEAGAGGSTQMLVRSELARIALFRDGDFELARQLLQDGLAMATGTETVTAELMLRHQLGNLAIVLGDYDEAVRIHEENVARAAVGGETYRRGWGLNSLSDALAHSGRLDRALLVADQVIRASDELGDPRLRMAGIAHKGLVAIYREDWVEALACFGEAQELNRRNGDPEKFATVANYLGEAALGAEELSRAAGEFGEALEIAGRAGVRTEQLRALAGLAAVAAAGGNPQLAGAGLALVAADPAAPSEARRLVRVAAERYRLTLGEPPPDRDQVIESLEAVAAGGVPAGS